MRENTRRTALVMERPDNQQERLVINFTPEYVVGLVDSEGYFSVYTRRRKFPTYATTETRMVFGVKLKARDREVLMQLQNFFGCGAVHFRPDDRKNFSNCYEYQVSSYKTLLETIIPFFEKHQLRFPSKREDFEKFRQIAQYVATKRHLSLAGIRQIERLAASMHH